MNATTPFSGISLVAHLLIIGWAKAKVYLGFQDKTAGSLSHNSRSRYWLKVAACHVIIFAVFTVMFTSLTIAVRTGIREGASEPQIKFVKKQATNLKALPWKETLTPLVTQSDTESLAEKIAGKLLAIAERK